MDRLQKKRTVAELRELVSVCSSVVIVHYQGLTVSDITKMRNVARGNSTNFQVIKNSLARLAFVGTEFEKLVGLLNGPTAIAFSKDPVAAAKSVVNFSEENEKLVVLGGMVNNQVLDLKGVKALAKLPSLDELRAKIISVISTPATRVAGVLQAPSGQIARVISRFAEKGI